MAQRPIDLDGLAYVQIGDCLRHTLDVIARLQDQANGTEAMWRLEAVRRDIVAVQNTPALAALFTASVVNRGHQ